MERLTNKKRFLYQAIFYGIWMFVIMTLVLPYSRGEVFTTRKLLIGALIWSIAGALFGYTMLLWNRRQSKKANNV